MLIGALELGGTKTIAAVVRGGETVEQVRLATGPPEETLCAVEAFFAAMRAEHGPVRALGIASFGPVHLDPASPRWGHIAATVKPGWSEADVGPRLARSLECQVALDTDVNAAALAEASLGAGKGFDPLVYLTVGTGIGGGLAVGGEPVRGLMHPEMGHVRLRRHIGDDYPGGCSFHGDCAEGLASGPAIVARFGTTLDRLPGDHAFRAILADYLGQLCAAIVLIVSPQRIVIGGGVVAGSGLHEKIAASMRVWLGGYVAAEAIALPGFVAPPVLPDAGLAGAALMARAIATK